MLTDEDRYNAELGGRIRLARGDVSKSRLARALGVPRTSLILMERGEQRVHAYMLIRIAQELSVDPASLLMGGATIATSGPDQNLGADATPAVRAYVANVREAARMRKGA